MIRKILKATILFLLLFPANLPAAMDYIFEESLSKSLAHVEMLYSKGQWNEAMNVGRGIMRDAPKDHPAIFRARDLIVLSLDGKNREILANQGRAKKRQNLDSAQQLITVGSKLLTDKSYKEAISKFSSAVRLQGGDAQTYFLLGYAQIKSGKRRAAYASLKKCLELKPSHTRGLFHIAGLSFEFEHGDEAEEYSRLLIETIEKQLKELKGAFIAHRSTGANDKAVGIARKMAALQNNLAQASVMYGTLTMKKKDYKKSVRAFERATKLKPDSSENWYHLGIGLLRLKVNHQATLAFEHAVDMKESELREISSKAGELLDQGKSDEAVDAELRARKLKEEAARYLYVLAIANGKKQNSEGALRNIDRALELKPDFIECRYTRAIILAEMNRLEEAVEQMREILKTSRPNSSHAKRSIKTITVLMGMIAKRDNPVEVAAVQKKSNITEVNAYIKDMPGIGGRKLENRLGEVFDRLRDVKNLINARNYPEAVRRLLYLRTQYPDIADIHSILGQCYMEMGRILDAERCFIDTLKVDNMHAEAMNSYAYILAIKGEKLPLALDYAQKAIIKDGMKAEFHHTLGWVLFKTGEVAKSILPFTHALEIRPNYILARYNLGLAYYLTQNFKGAIDSFNSVLAIDPVHNKALLFKSISLARVNKGKDAIVTIEKLKSKLDKKSVLGKVVTNLHSKLKLAHERHEKLPVPEIKSPAPIEKLMAEAAKFRSNSLVTRAKEKYLEAQRLAPERFEPPFALGEMYAEAGLNAPALASWEQAAKINPNHFMLQLNLGKMHHKLGRANKAREYFTKAQALDEKNEEPKYYLGLLAYEAKSYESAESHALAALRLKPNFYKGMALLGMARIRLNRLRPARDIYETLYAKAPADSSIKQHARKKIWELTRMMAPSQFPSIESALETKKQMVKKASGSDFDKNYKPEPNEVAIVAEYGKNTMTVDDKAWVLRQLNKFGNIPTPTPIAPLRKDINVHTMANAEKSWMIKKLQGFDSQRDKYALKPEVKTGKYLIKTTEKKFQRKPDKADDIVRKGLEMAEKGFINDAIKEFENAQKISPENIESLINMGFAHTIQGNFKSAFDAYAQATMNFPENSLARLGLGNLYWLGGKAREAIEQWKLIKEPFRSDAEFCILSRSKKIWQRMLEISPEDPDAHSNLGLVYMFEGEYNHALTEFKAVTKLEEDRKEHEFYQAQIYVLKYLSKSNKKYRKEANEILAALSKGTEPFPHAAKLNSFVKSL